MDDIDSLSSGSMSPDLGEMWRQGCPKSPEWEGDLELGSADEEEEGDNAGSSDEMEDEGLKDYLNRVNDSPLGVLVRDYLTPADTLEMRTTALKCNIARLHGSFAKLWFYLMKNDKSEPLTDWPRLHYCYRQFYGFGNGMFEPGRLPDLTAFGSSGEWT